MYNQHIDRIDDVGSWKQTGRVLGYKCNFNSARSEEYLKKKSFVIAVCNVGGEHVRPRVCVKVEENTVELFLFLALHIALLFFCCCCSLNTLTKTAKGRKCLFGFQFQVKVHCCTEKFLTEAEA